MVMRIIHQDIFVRCQKLPQQTCFEHAPGANYDANKIKIIHVRGREVTECCEMLRFSYCLENGLRGGGEYSSLTQGRALLRRNILISVSGIHLCLRLIEPNDVVRLKGLNQLQI